MNGDGRGRLIVEGIGASPGRALGRVHRLESEMPEVPHRTIGPDEVEDEIARFNAARDMARERLLALVKDTRGRFGRYEGKILEAQVLLIDDPMIVDGTLAYIGENHLAAEQAFELQMLGHRVKMLDSGQAMVLDSLSDLQDVRQRLLSALLGVPDPELPDDAEEPLILVARDLPPSMAARLDPGRIVGFVTARGSRGGHSVLIARSLGIPATVGLGAVAAEIPHGAVLLMDGRSGRLIIDPSPRDIESYRRDRVRLAERREAIERADRADGRPNRTTDGVEVIIQANADRPGEVEQAATLGAQGIGLLRSEFLVIGHPEIPSESEQYDAYRGALEACPDHEVTLRTFDIGGDKFPMFLTMPQEENPYLGWRGIRVCLDLPDLFLNQLRAAVRASAHGRLRLLLPMITSIDEIERTRELLAGVYAELGDEGPESPLPLGIMVETPAVVELLEQIAPRVDFVSLGTNDLTQYVLAADRGNAKLAGLFDPMHPAMVAQYRRIATACRNQDLELGVCGELAGEPAGLALLVGLGYTKLSVSPAVLAEQREVARSLSAAELADLVAAEWGSDGPALRLSLNRYLSERGVPDGDDVRLSAE